jgi:hypothetical protein
VPGAPWRGVAWRGSGGARTWPSPSPSPKPPEAPPPPEVGEGRSDMLPIMPADPEPLLRAPEPLLRAPDPLMRGTEPLFRTPDPLLTRKWPELGSMPQAELTLVLEASTPETTPIMPADER